MREKEFESLVVKVHFDLIGLTAYNRQQICERTRKGIDEDVRLVKGEFFYYESTKYIITNVEFRLLREKMGCKTIEVFSDFDNNFTNCEVYVSAEIVK
ncbi:hypothetical protein [Flavobacterium sp. XGLA_31]|uniref:hypothetical protein n=1 Tax=Flavobacterium sp. XGLA_31 TaxID=3447666 RepID=UPI003F2FBD8C